MKQRKRAIAVVIMFTAFACRHFRPEVNVDTLWSAKEQELLSAAKEWKQDDLMRTVAFFETTTGIMSHLRVGYLGVQPTQIDESLAEWRSWYKQNRPLLRVDPSTGRIEKKRQDEFVN